MFSWCRRVWRAWKRQSFCRFSGWRTGVNGGFWSLTKRIHGWILCSVKHSGLYIISCWSRCLDCVELCSKTVVKRRGRNFCIKGKNKTKTNSETLDMRDQINPSEHGRERCSVGSLMHHCWWENTARCLCFTCSCSWRHTQMPMKMQPAR